MTARSHFAGPGPLALVAALAMAPQSLQSAVIRGSATLCGDGSPLPGVEVVARGADLERRGLTGPDGHYELPGLADGIYELQARLPGFRTANRHGVVVSPGASIAVDWSLGTGPMEEFLWAPPRGGILEAYRLADAVVDLRITSSTEARLWDTGGPCGASLLGVRHEGTIRGALKLDVHQSGDASRLRFLQYPAGEWSDEDGLLKGDEAPYSAGNEYVFFLRWNPDLGVFTRLAGPIFVLLVADGRIYWNRRRPSDTAGLESGMTVASFFAALRSLEADGRAR